MERCVTIGEPSYGELKSVGPSMPVTAGGGDQAQLRSYASRHAREVHHRAFPVCLSSWSLRT
jgi:hypothetical protein